MLPARYLITDLITDLTPDLTTDLLLRAGASAAHHRQPGHARLVHGAARDGYVAHRGGGAAGQVGRCSSRIMRG